MNKLGQVLLCFFVTLLSHNVRAAELAAKPIISDENILIVELAVGQDATEENIEVYQHEGGFLVPLGFLTQFVDFAIDVNMDDAQASGWFIRESRNFLLDVHKATVTIDGKETSLGGRIVSLGVDDIYVDSSLFSEWFPIDLELNFSQLLLKLKPREKLAFQERAERTNLRNRINRNEKKVKDYPKIDTQKENFSMPFFDVDLGNQYASNATPHNNTNYSILAQGDTAKLSTHVFMAGDSSEDLKSARLKAGNKDKDSGLLGALHASEYSMGDIDSVALPLVSNTGHGVGAFISNIDLERPDQFDQTNFVGNSQPGWEVELYRNGELLEFQVVGSDGRYAFNDITVLYGNNNFKIMSYGPQGQVNEESKTYNIDDSISKKNRFNYRVSVDEKSQSLFGIDEQDTIIGHKKEGRFIGDFEYGLLDKLTVSSGVVSTPLEDQKTHKYQTFGLKTNILGTLSSLNTAYDYENKGMAGSAAVNTNIKDVSARLEHKQFNNFISEEEAFASPRRKSTSKLDLNGRFGVIFPSGMSYGVGAQQENFVANRQVNTYSNRLATSFFGVGFANNIQWQETLTGDTASTIGDGSFSIRGNYRQIFLRLSTDYTYSPLSEFRSVSLSTQKELTGNVNLRSDIKKDLGSADLTTVSASLNKEFKYYRLSTTATADTADAYSLGVLLSFSLGYNGDNKEWFSKNRSIANDGAISASAFLDKNYNGMYDNDDSILENAAFDVSNRKYEPGPGDKKSTLITGVTPYVPADIEVNLASLEDPFLVTKPAGYNVTTRPGVITKVTFPVIYTTEIDGNLFLQKGDNVRPVARAVMQLIDKDGKIANSTKSEYDGFYVFSGVVPGEYTIELAEETLKKLHISLPPQVPVSVVQDSDVISGLDITAVIEE